MEYLEDISLISDQLVSFRSAHSFFYQLLLTYNDLCQSIDNGLLTDLGFFDYCKAFNKVVHSILIYKLALIGVCPHILTWIAAFLQHREMRVGVLGTVSS